MSVRHTGADLGRSLTGDFTEDEHQDPVTRLRVRIPDDALADPLVAPRPDRVADVLPEESRERATVAVR
jgi:hypothetical protein